jgi:hypothetical protein
MDPVFSTKVSVTGQWNPETTDPGWHWLRRRDTLEWRLAENLRTHGSELSF